MINGRFSAHHASWRCVLPKRVRPFTVEESATLFFAPQTQIEYSRKLFLQITFAAARENLLADPGTIPCGDNLSFVARAGDCLTGPHQSSVWVKLQIAEIEPHPKEIDRCRSKSRIGAWRLRPSSKAASSGWRRSNASTNPLSGMSPGTTPKISFAGYPI